MLPEKPYALSCDRNSEPILDVLKKHIGSHKKLFEVGAGTGQHAVFMAPHFPHMQWVLSDVEERIEGIQMWLKDFPRSNVQGPVEYDIDTMDIPVGDVDVIFTANTLHIISWELCLKLFEQVKSLPEGGLFLVYGAFNYNGTFTSESNERFQKWILDKFPGGGIRDFEKVQSELSQRGVNLLHDYEMPANNRLLVFEKSIRH